MVHSHQDQAVGTLGGTLVAFFGIVDGGDILKTIILACVGAIVSFCVSKGMHLVWSGANPSRLWRDKPQPSLKKEGVNSGKMPVNTASKRDASTNKYHPGKKFKGR
jgi:hypothetical protein